MFCPQGVFVCFVWISEITVTLPYTSLRVCFLQWRWKVSIVWNEPRVRKTHYTVSLKIKTSIFKIYLISNAAIRFMLYTIC